jgi:hypothetical protein
MYDNEAVARYLHGGLDRMRANVAVSQAAYAEASERGTRDRAGIAAAKAALQVAGGVRPAISLK